MCQACGISTHVLELEPAPAPARAGKFAALRNKDCRPYLIGGGLSMMADILARTGT